MKRLFLLLVITFAFTTIETIQAQGFIRGGAGFGIGTTKDVFALPAIYRDPNNKITNVKAVFGSFGQGGRFSLAGGYMITPYFGVELQFYYYLGTKQDYGSDVREDGNTWHRTGFSYQMRAVPSLVIQVPDLKFQPYARMGVVLPLVGETIIEEEMYFANTGNTQNTQLNVNGKFSVGFEASLGLQYNVTDNLGIYIEATYTGLRIKSKDAQFTKDVTTKKNGEMVDHLDSKATLERYIVFQDELISGQSNQSTLLTGNVPNDVIMYLSDNPDFDKPLNVLTQTSNFNALTFSVGVKYTFNKKS